MKDNYCVIMAGGAGTRFWPMSRSGRPKQSIDILGTGETLIQQTYNRFLNVCPSENIYVVTSEDYRGIVKEQLPDLSDFQILGEPSRRNTAPCIAYANHKIFKKNPNARIVVAPSDHIILKESVFNKVINDALNVVGENDWLLTIGIKPNRPDTGYGYIQYSEQKNVHRIEDIRKVKTFTEKPILELAKTFVESGDFLWNAGIFIWSLKSIEKAFNQYLPEVNKLFDEGFELYDTPQEEEFINNTYGQCKNISIDYGIMEKADNVYVYAADLGWSDLGTWGSLFENSDKNEDNNAIVGKNVLTYSTKDCIINVPNSKLVVAQGLEGYIVAAKDNAILICKREDEQMIRNIVNDIKIEKGENFI